ncbi:MAG: hypothetical protein R6X06_04080 [Gammaproteobacteria bacterium]
MKKPPEIVPGDRELRWKVLLAVALYILWLLWLEPLIDVLLTASISDPLAIARLDAAKVRVAGMAYSLTRILPIALFLWIGYRIVASARLPPARMRFPFTVVRIEGRNARMFGLLCIVISLLVLANEAYIVARLFI